MIDKHKTNLEIGDWVRFFDASVFNNSSVGIVLKTEPYELNRGMVRIRRQSNVLHEVLRNHEYVERISDEEAMMMALEKYAG